jgi:hypothetical protein
MLDAACVLTGVCLGLHARTRCLQLVHGNVSRFAQKVMQQQTAAFPGRGFTIQGMLHAANVQAFFQQKLGRSVGIWLEQHMPGMRHGSKNGCVRASMHIVHLPGGPDAVIASTLRTSHLYKATSNVCCCVCKKERLALLMPQNSPGVVALSLAVLALVHHPSPL